MKGLGDALFLASRSLRASPWRSAVLVFGTAVAIFLPLFTFRAAAYLETALLARAEASPVLIGQKGDEFDLTMNALYFRGQVAETLPFGARRELSAYGTVLPLYVAYSVSGTPLVGTSIEYFEARGLRARDGRLPALLGEVVVGAEAADDFDLAPGDRVRSDLTNLYNLAGAYPLLLDVVGVLEPAGTPDDGAFFADVKTAWMLDGRLHGHQEVTAELALPGPTEPAEIAAPDGAGAAGAPDQEATSDEEVASDQTAPDLAPGRPDASGEEEHVEASAAIFLFSELTAANRDDFHMHGSVDEAPVGSLLVLPRDQRAHDQLLGDMAVGEQYQAVRPVRVIRAVLDIVLRLRDGLSAYFGLVAFSTLAFFGLVLALTLRLRQAEMDLMRRLGCGRFRIAGLVGAEVALIVSAAALVAIASAQLGLALIDAALRG